MTGVGNRIVLIEEAIRYPYGSMPRKVVKPPSWLLTTIRNAGKELGYKVEYSKFYICGDEGPFSDMGAPAVMVMRMPVDPYYHSERDTIERCDLNALKSVADMTVAAALNLAKSEKIPPE